MRGKITIEIVIECAVCGDTEIIRRPSRDPSRAFRVMGWMERGNEWVCGSCFSTNRTRPANDDEYFDEIADEIGDEMAEIED